MDRYQDSDYNQNVRRHGDHAQANGNRKQKRRWIPVAAVIAAITVAASAIGISAAETTTQDSGTAYLTLTDTSSMEQETQAQAAGYVLTDVSDVVEEVLPSVVSITSRQLINYYGNYGGNGSGFEDFSDIWEFFFGDSYGGRGNSRRYYQESPYEEYESEEPEEEETPNEVESGMGSGTIIAENDSELLILTSYHVVEGCSSLYVTFINDANVDGYIKAADYDNDIAIVAIPLADIDQETLNSIKIATISTEEPRVGEGCLVIGNALGYGISVTSGIVSKIDRQMTIDDRTLDVIQTDAAINFGNSGGCMVNENGEVIGIAEAKTTMSYVEGMCYAIPVARNLDLIQELMNAEEPFDEAALQEQSQNTTGAFLGIRGRDVNDELSQEFEMPVGIYVSSVVMGSGAEEAGIQSGDIIVGFDGEDITTMAELQYILANFEAGDTVSITINRLVDGAYQTMDLDVTLTDRIS